MSGNKYERVAEYYSNHPELVIEGWYNEAPCIDAPSDLHDLPAALETSTVEKNIAEKEFIENYCRRCPMTIAQSCFIDALQGDEDAQQVRGGQPAKEVIKYVKAYRSKNQSR